MRFELSGVARSRSGRSLTWLVMERAGVDACVKDPGYPIDAIVSGPIAALIGVYLGHLTWREATRKDLAVSGDARAVARWLRLDRILGRDLPLLPPGELSGRQKVPARA